MYNLEREEIAERLAPLGVTQFLARPIFPSEFLRATQAALGLQVAPREGAGMFTAAPDLTGKTILVVEDDAINREIVAAMLAETRASIVEARNGREAVALVAQEPGRYDLILMDIQMPEMNGVEAMHAIRLLWGTRARTAPIVALTANVFSEEVEQYLGEGMDDHIAKPISVDILFEKLTKYLLIEGDARMDTNYEKNAMDLPEIGTPTTLEGFSPYIDVAKALNSLRQNRKLYARLLSSFIKDNPYADMREKLTAGDVENGERAAHALKGVTANLAINELYHAVMEMEAILKTGVMPPQDMIERVYAVYERTYELLPQAVSMLEGGNDA